ncbi:MAG: ECF transporter S component [Anaerolineaceae bacterium]
MAQNRTRKIVVAGVLSAISILLGLTRWGFLPWFSGTSLTIMHVPVIIGAILEGPVVGAVIGLIFGLFSWIQSVAPNGTGDIIFSNIVIAVLPRLFIGPIAWLVYTSLKRWQVPAIIVSAIAGSATNTVLVLGMIGLWGYFPWVLIGTTTVVNGLPEIVISAIITLLVVAVVRQIRIGKRQGSQL